MRFDLPTDLVKARTVEEYRAAMAPHAARLEREGVNVDGLAEFMADLADDDGRLHVLNVFFGKGDPVGLSIAPGSPLHDKWQRAVRSPSGHYTPGEREGLPPVRRGLMAVRGVLLPVLAVVTAPLLVPYLWLVKRRLEKGPVPGPVYVAASPRLLLILLGVEAALLVLLLL